MQRIAVFVTPRAAPCSTGGAHEASYAITLDAAKFARLVAQSTVEEYKAFCAAPSTAATVQTLLDTLRAGACLCNKKCACNDETWYVAVQQRLCLALRQTLLHVRAPL